MDLITAVTSFKTILDSAKVIKDMSDAATRNSAVIELQQRILGIQSEFMELASRLSEAEAKLKSAQVWLDEAERYALKDYGGSTFAYELRPKKSNGEPDHRLCPNCFQQKQKAILQFSRRDASGQEHYNCLGCKGRYSFGLANPISYRPVSGATDWRL